MMHLNLRQHDEWLDSFYQTLGYAQSLNDPLSRNYTRDRIPLENFPYFSIVVISNQIVAFSGLQVGRWGDKIGRVASRLWVHPDWRSQNGRPSEFNSKVMMPHQTLWAQENGFDCVFFSREQPYKHFDFIVKRSNKHCPFGFVYTTMPHIYNVCLNSDDETCWQKVAVCEFTSNTLELPCRD